MSQLIVPSEDIEPVAIPSDRLWFDPQMLTMATEIVFTDVPCGMNVKQPACTMNASRWGIGFYQSSAPTNINVAPWPDVDKFIVAQSTLNVAIPFFKLFDYGPLVCNRWFIFASANCTVRVVELLRMSGE